MKRQIEKYKMDISKQLVVQLCDLQKCFSSPFTDPHQQNFQFTRTKNIPHVLPWDSEHGIGLTSKRSKKVDEEEMNFIIPENKLNVELCDFMVCKKNCCAHKYKNGKVILTDKKRKVHQQYSYSKAKIQEKSSKETCDEKNINEDEISEELFKDEDDTDYEEMNISDEDWEEMNIPKKFSERYSVRKKKEEQRKEEKQRIIKEKRRENKEEQRKIEKNQKKIEAEQRKEEKKHKREKEQIENLSYYELMRQKNLEEKMAFLKSLNIEEIRQEFKKNAISTRKTRIPKPKVHLDPRKSKRLENSENKNLSVEAMCEKVFKRVTVSRPLKRDFSFEDIFLGVGVMDPSYILPVNDRHRLSNDFDKNFRNLKMKNGFEEEVTQPKYNFRNLKMKNEFEEEVTQPNFPYDLKCFELFKDDGWNFTNYEFKSIASAVFHPAVDRTILFLGSCKGQLALWNTETEPYLFAPYTDRVSNIKVSTARPFQIFSSSIDGTLRLADIENKSFYEIFKENVACNHFEFISPNQVLIAQSNGFVKMLDIRDRQYKYNRNSFRCSETAVQTIDVHPENKNVFLSLDSKGLIKIWDIRKSPANCILSSDTQNSGLLSAFFSPVTGKSILCSSKVSISMYDNLYQQGKLDFLWHFRLKYKKIKGRSLGHKEWFRCDAKSFTRAHWLPNSESDFIVCSNFIKRMVILNRDNGKEMSHFKTTSITNFHFAHPAQNMLALIKVNKVQLYVQKMDT